MSQLINCSKCGALFIKKDKPICDNCIKKIQELQDDIIKYVLNSPLEKVHINTIVEHFEISMNELEQYLTGRKLAEIEKKLSFSCLKCKKTFPIDIPFSSMCKKCTFDMKQEVLKRIV